MLKFPDDIRIHLAVVPVDMRKSFDGLSAVIMEALECNPLSGDLFLFRGKRADRIKAVYWDRNGLAIWSKRLERGKFKWPLRGERSFEITSQELSLLLDGIDFTRLKRLPSVHAEAVL
jgi:transposase